MTVLLLKILEVQENGKCNKTIRIKNIKFKKR